MEKGFDKSVWVHFDKSFFLATQILSCKQSPPSKRHVMRKKKAALTFYKTAEAKDTLFTAATPDTS